MLLWSVYNFTQAVFYTGRSMQLVGKYNCTFGLGSHDKTDSAVIFLEKGILCCYNTLSLAINELNALLIILSTGCLFKLKSLLQRSRLEKKEENGTWNMISISKDLFLTFWLLIATLALNQLAIRIAVMYLKAIKQQNIGAQHVSLLSKFLFKHFMGRECKPLLLFLNYISTQSQLHRHQ